MEQSWNGFIRKAVGVLEKYLEISKIYMKTQLAWRGDVLFNMFFTIARIIFAYLLWGIVFQNHEMVGQFTFHGMLSYYIIHSFLSQLEMSDGISAEIHDRIRNGTFPKYMVIPVGIERYFMAMELGVVLFYMAFDFIAAVVDGSLFAIQVLAFGAVYSQVETVGNWGQGEMILYIGTFSLLNAINMTVYFFGVNSIPHKVRSGELDLYLTKPVSPLLHLSLENISPGSIPLIVMSLCIIGYGIRMLMLELTMLMIFSYLFWLIIMEILYYEMEIIIRSFSLYTVSMVRLEQIEETGIDLCMKLPGIAFHGLYKVVFYLILPYGIMATFPVQSMIGEMNLLMAVYGISVAILFTVITTLIWKRGLKHYNSTGL